jgi:hypothetical protein
LPASFNVRNGVIVVMVGPSLTNLQERVHLALPVD